MGTADRGRIVPALGIVVLVLGIVVLVLGIVVPALGIVVPGRIVLGTLLLLLCSRCIPLLEAGNLLVGSPLLARRMVVGRCVVRQGAAGRR